MAVRKQHWSSRFQSAWVLDFTHEDGVEHDLQLFRTKVGAVRAMTELMHRGMNAYGLHDQLRAELEGLLRQGAVEAAIMMWWDLYHEEFHIDEIEIEE